MHRVNYVKGTRKTTPPPSTQNLAPEITPREFEQTLAPEITPREFEQTLAPEITSRESEQTLAPEITSRESEQTLAPEITSRESEQTLAPEITSREPAQNLTPERETTIIPVATDQVHTLTPPPVHALPEEDNLELERTNKTLIILINSFANEIISNLESKSKSKGCLSWLLLLVSKSSPQDKITKLRDVIQNSANSSAETIFEKLAKAAATERKRFSFRLFSCCCGKKDSLSANTTSAKTLQKLARQNHLTGDRYNVEKILKQR